MTIASPRRLFLQRLNPVNFPLAWIWSFFRPVSFWRSERLPSSALDRFDVLDPADFYGIDEWHSQQEAAFLAWNSARRERDKEFGASIGIGANTVDYRASWSQWLALGFEERFLFLRMVSRASGRASVGGGLLEEILPENVRGKLDFGHSSRVRGFAVLDRIWNIAVAFGKTAKRLRSLLVRRGNIGVGPCQVLWAGISAGEIANADNRLSFSFAVEHGVLGKDACLYVLSSPPSPDAELRLRLLGIRWITVAAFGFLPLRRRAAAIWYLSALSSRGFFGALFSIEKAILWGMAADSVAWIEAARFLKCKTYLTSVSNSWPEPPEVDALKAIGVRTVNWSYGANTFCFCEDNPGFRDLALSRSIASSDEIWVWNALVADWLKMRLRNPARTAIRITGPVMCGSSRWLSLTPANARHDYGLTSKLIISIFDVPPISREMRLAIGHGPSIYPLEMLERFFDDIESLLARFSEASILIKPKRSLTDMRRNYAASMRRILDPDSEWNRGGRIIMLPHDVDPYIPVALADVCIGVPFTSPVMTALEAGRGGVFHDPLSRVLQVPGAPQLLEHVTHGRAQLHDRVAGLLGAHRGEIPRLNLEASLSALLQGTA